MGTRRPLIPRERPTQNARIPFRSTFGFAVNDTTILSYSFPPPKRRTLGGTAHRATAPCDAGARLNFRVARVRTGARKALGHAPTARAGRRIASGEGRNDPVAPALALHHDRYRAKCRARMHTAPNR